MAEKRVNTIVNGREILLSDKAQKLAIRFFGASKIIKPTEVGALRPDIKAPIKLKDIPPEIKRPVLKEVPPEVKVNDPLLNPDPVKVEDPVKATEKEPEKAPAKPKAKRKPAKK